MANGHVEYSLPTELMPLSVKSASFVSNQFPVNNNPNLSFILSIAASSSLSGTAKVQSSNEDGNWIDIKGTQTNITGDDEILWTLSELQSLMHLRLSVAVSSGSGIFKIIARGT